MSGVVVALLLAAGVFMMIWVVVKDRSSRLRIEARRLPGQLTAAERKHLYRRLGLNPAQLDRNRQSNVIWLDPRVIDRRRTDA